MDKVKIVVQLPKKDFSNSESVEITLNVDGFDKNMNLVYSYKIPDYIYNELKDTEEKYKSYENSKISNKEHNNNHLNGSNISYFKKIIKKILISEIISEISELTLECVSRNTRDGLKKSKKIFIRFHDEHYHDKCTWTGGYKGEIISTQFQYFIGYEIEERKDIFNIEIIKNYYTLIKHQSGSFAKWSTNFKEGYILEPLYFKNDRNSFLSRYNIIDWSEEREVFFEKIKENFIVINAKLSNYLSDIDDDKINLLMSNNNFKLLE